MRIAASLCLLFLLLVSPVVPARSSDLPGGASPGTGESAGDPAVQPGALEELQVRFHERQPFLEPLELVEPEEQADEYDGPLHMELVFFGVGEVSGGAHDGADIVLLRYRLWDDGPCKGEGCGGPDYRHLRYLKSGRRMILLGAISDGRFPGKTRESQGRFLGQDPFARFDLVEERDDDLTIPGFDCPAEITGPEPRQVLRLVDEQEGRPDPAKLVKVFAHPQLEDVLTTRPELSPSNRLYAHQPCSLSEADRPRYDYQGITPGSCYGEACYTTNAFFVFRPDGTFLRYAYRPDLDATGIQWLPGSHTTEPPLDAAGRDAVWLQGLKGPLRREQYTFLSHISCSGTLVDDIAVVDPESLGLRDLKQVAIAPGGDPILAPHPADRLHEELYEFYKATYRYDQRGEVLEQRIAFPEFVRARPILFWRDPFGRLIRLTRAAFVQPALCEPIVYLYPAVPQDVIVSLGGIRPSASTPEYGAGWKVEAHPDGELRDARDGRRYPYLFWEAPSPFVESPEEGAVVPVAEVESFLQDALARLGLNENERGDFLEAWLPLLDDAPYYFISFFERRLIDALAPLEVTPAPDTVIRVLMDYRPLDAPIDVAPQELGPPPRREGFTLVEWGGLRR